MRAVKEGYVKLLSHFLFLPTVAYNAKNVTIWSSCSCRDVCNGYVMGAIQCQKYD